MKKIKPIAFTNIEEINFWIVKNFDDYIEAKEVIEKRINPITDLKERATVSLKYSEERLFCFYFESLKNLLILRNKDENLKQFIEEYHTCKNDKELLDNWYSNIDYNIHKIDSNYSGMCFIEYQNSNPIGIKPFESKIYKENPFLLPTDGFENLIELAKLINLIHKDYLYCQFPQNL